VAQVQDQAPAIVLEVVAIVVTVDLRHSLESSLDMSTRMHTEILLDMRTLERVTADNRNGLIMEDLPLENKIK
jgi:spore coat protein CotF